MSGSSTASSDGGDTLNDRYRHDGTPPSVTSASRADDQTDMNSCSLRPLQTKNSTITVAAAVDLIPLLYVNEPSKTVWKL